MAIDFSVLDLIAQTTSSGYGATDSAFVLGAAAIIANQPTRAVPSGMDGETLDYYAFNGSSEYELGRGTYTHSGTTLGRSDANVRLSSNSNNRVAFSSAPTVCVVFSGRFFETINTLLDLSTGTAAGARTALGLDMHSAKMVRAATQSIPALTPTKILFDTEVYDNGGIADPTTNNRFDIVTTGLYNISCSMRITGLDLGERIVLYIYINGVSNRLAISYSPGTNRNPTGYISEMFELSASDTIEMYVMQESSSSQDTYTGISARPVMCVTRLL